MHRVVKRRHAAVALIFVALQACAGGVRYGGNGSAPVTITWFASSLTNSGQDPRQSLIDAFEKAYPLIKVELISAPTNTDENRATLRDAIMGNGDGPSPDVYLGDVVWPAEFAQDGLALPLDAVIPASFWSRFPPEFVDAASYKGRIYAVPFFADQGVLLYRRDLLAREHLPYPPRTWEELSAEARVLLHKGLVSDGFVWQGARYEGLTCVWTEFAADTGVEAPYARDLASRIDSPRSLRALTFMHTLLATGVSPPDVTNLREAQSQQIFESGHAAFLRTWSSAYVDMAKLVGSPVRGKVGVAPLPHFDGGEAIGASTIGGWDLYINPHTRHLPEVLTLIKWMTDFPAQHTLAQYSIIPTNIVVRSDQTLADHAVFEALARMRPIHRPSGTPIYPAVSEVIYTDVYHALRGSVTPQVALREAQAQIDRVLAAHSP